MRPRQCLLSLRRAATPSSVLAYYTLHKASIVREELLWGYAQNFPGCRGAACS